MDYCPHPIDVSGVELSADLRGDVEMIAKDVHEVWAQQRLQRGWGYGETLDTRRKTHPCLVAYDALPEVEKDMDRATVIRTVKLLLRLGYQIEKRERL